MAKKFGRRAFIITGSILGGGLAVGVGGLTYVNRKLKQFPEFGTPDGHTLNAFVHIQKNSRVTMAIARAEMGQGVSTALPQLIAEELEVDMSQIDVIHPQIASPYANIGGLPDLERDPYNEKFNLQAKIIGFLPLLFTGGSTSVPDAYTHLRVMGASAREMLIQAAAKKWEIATSDCYAENGHVVNKNSQEKVAYGELAEAAIAEKPPKRPPLKPRSEFKIVGKPVDRLDVPAKVDGTAEFGIDARPEGLLFAAMKHSPVIGAKITGVKNKEEVLGMPGVKKVVQIEEGVAVVADNTWRAKNAALKLELDYDPQGNETLSTEGIKTEFAAAFAKEPTLTAEEEGDVMASLETAAMVVEAKYEVPYLAHACMEPMNCTVLYNKDAGTAEVWVGHQAPSIAVWRVNDALDIKAEDVTLNMKYLGGGFGRRGEPDIVSKAARVAKEMPGTPVQLVWTREEDMQNDYYRPLVLSNFKGGLDASGKATAWHNHMSLQSVAIDSFGRAFPSLVPKPEDDIGSAEGAMHLPYDFGTRKVDISLLENPVRLGFWRSVGSSQHAYFTESFLDELAAAAGEDGYTFRRELLVKAPRFKAVLDRAAEMSNWSQPLEEGRGRGIALHMSFGSIVAEVVEIILVNETDIKLDKVYCAVDCGLYVNPQIIEAQMQSAIVYGLSAALYGEMTIKDGKFKQSNFPNYQMVKLAQMPHIEVGIMENEEQPGGVGEPGLPPIAPALCNAIYDVTGKRIRSLPLKNHGFKFV
ncbi:MAG: molybdopterin cofactor-binding domain-containing protein [Bacteroidota bacterium]